MRGPHGANAIDVGAGLDLQLDPPVALLEVAVDLLEERRRSTARSRCSRRTRRGCAPRRATRRATSRRLGAPRRRTHRAARPSPSGSRGPSAKDSSTLATSTSPARNSAGARKSRRTSQAPSLNSPLKSGWASATHSPQPSRVVGLDPNEDAALLGDLPKLVRNGRTSGSSTRSSSIARTGSRALPGDQRVRGPGPIEGPRRSTRPEARLQRLGRGLAPACGERRVPASEVRMIARDLHDGSVGGRRGPWTGRGRSGSPSAVSTAGRPSGQARRRAPGRGPTARPAGRSGRPALISSVISP